MASMPAATVHSTMMGITASGPRRWNRARLRAPTRPGTVLEYTPVPAALTFHGMNTALFAAGDNGRNPNLYYKTVEFRDMGKKQYRKYYF